MDGGTQPKPAIFGVKPRLHRTWNRNFESLPPGESLQTFRAAVCRSAPGTQQTVSST
jgi:hypothetical protein